MRSGSSRYRAGAGQALFRSVFRRFTWFCPDFDSDSAGLGCGQQIWAQSDCEASAIKPAIDNPIDVTMCIFYRHIMIQPYTTLDM